MKQYLILTVLIILTIYCAGMTYVAFLLAGLARFGWIFPISTFAITVFFARLAYLRFYKLRHSSK